MLFLKIVLDLKKTKQKKPKKCWYPLIRIIKPILGKSRLKFARVL